MLQVIRRRRNHGNKSIILYSLLLRERRRETGVNIINIVLTGIIIAAVFYYLGYLFGSRDSNRRNKLEYYKKGFTEGYRKAETK